VQLDNEEEFKGTELIRNMKDLEKRILSVENLSKLEKFEGSEELEKIDPSKGQTK